MEYCISAFLERQDEKIYRVYVTDALKAVAENTVKAHGGFRLNNRYAEMIDREKPDRKEETAEEIIDRIKSGLRRL